MVDFRKAFLLLVVVFVAVASAQVTPLSCSANAGVPPIARAEGVAEEVGQVIINCVGGTPTPYGVAIPTVNVQIFLNTNVTSRLLNSNSIATEALLLIDEPTVPAATQGGVIGTQLANAFQNVPVVKGTGSGAYYGGANPASPDPLAGPRPNVFQGQLAGANSIAWLGVPFDPPGTSVNRVMRLVNVRANANQLGVSSTLIPTAINMFISLSGPGSLALVNPQLTVAYVQNGMKFSADTANYNQCEPGTYTFNAKFAELFGTAFRKNILDTDVQGTPGTIYNTESMFYSPALNAQQGTLKGAGYATQATQLILRFSSVPANVAISVPTTSIVGVDTVILEPTASGSTTGSDGKVVLTGGAGAAVFTVTASNPGQISTVTIPVSVTYAANPLPGLGTATVTGNYAPTTTVFTASTTAPAPRFVDNPQSATTFTINSCQTNLLFPYVTNQGGFDTGIAISNTSADPYGTVPQRGPCTLYYYGGTAGGGAAPGSQTTGTINEGQQAIFTLSNGGTPGITATPGFGGYIIARCNFQYAHAYAFVSDLGSSRVAEGYLALVLDTDMNNPATGVGRKGTAKSERLVF